MQTYIGTKIIQAEPMTCGEAAALLQRPTTHADDHPGYLVQYPDGYRSWSPQEAFEEAYQPCDGLTFGMALEALKKGCKVARRGWNGKGMWLSLSGKTAAIAHVCADDFWSPHNAEFARQLGGFAPVLPAITMKTATGEILMGWLASQTDMLAEDWEILS